MHAVANFEKLDRMRDAGIVLAETPSEIGDSMVKAMGGHSNED